MGAVSRPLVFILLDKNKKITGFATITSFFLYFRQANYYLYVFLSNQLILQNHILNAIIARCVFSTSWIFHPK